MRISTRMQKTLVVGLLAVVCVLFSAANAFAAEKVNKVTSISYAYVGTSGDSQVMLNIQIPESVKLPAELEFNFPMGTTVSWAGEILGGDTSKDPQVTATKISGDEDVDRYKVTLTKSHTFQAEGSKNPESSQSSDGTVILKVGYKPALPAETMTLAAELPKTATVKQADGLASLGSGTVGTVYGYSLSNAKAGEGQYVEIGYTSTSTQKQAGSKGDNTLIIVLVVALVIVVMALIIFAASRRTGGSSPSGKPGNPSKKVMKGSSSAKAQQGSSLEKSDTPHQVFEVDEDAQTRSEVETEVESVNLAETEESDDGDSSKLSPKTLTLIITVAIIVVAGVAIALAGTLSSKVSEVNGVYYKEFAQGDPCQQVHFELTDAALSNSKKAAGEIFDILGNADFQILKASLDPANKKLTVEFCESKTTSQKISELLSNNEYVGQSDAISTGEAIVETDGSTSMYMTEVAPCVYDAFEIKNPSGDVADLVKKMYEASKDIPSIARMNYNSDTKIATFGFCDEQAGDADIQEALESAGFKVKLAQKAQAPQAATGE